MDALRGEGAFVFKVWGSDHMMVGLPDLIGCYGGRFFALETKMPDKRKNTSVRQDYVMDLIRRAGGIAQVVCSPQEALNILTELDRR
jgi:Holliday junction resolvase